MLIIIVVLFILMFSIGVRLNKKLKVANRFLLFALILWFICLSLSTINLYDLYEVSTSTYLLLLLDVISFFLGYCSIRAVSDKGDSSISFDSLLQSRIYKVFLCFCTIVSVYMAVTQYNIIAAYGLGIIREDFWDIMFERQPFWLAFAYTFILQGFFFFAIPLLMYCLENRSHIFDIICLTVFLFTFSFIAGGRVRFLYIVVGAIFYIISRYKVFRPSRVSYKLMIIFIAGAVIAATAMSTLRAGEQEVTGDNLSVGWKKNAEQAVTYNTGSFVALDRLLHSSKLDLIGGPYIFRATFGGWEEFMSKIGGKLFGKNFDHINKRTVYYFQDHTVMISNDIVFNYAYTNLIYHYIDLGVFGVFLYPFLFGLFIKVLINRMNRTNSAYLFCLLSFLFIVVSQSPFTLLIVKPFALPYILILLFLDYFKYRKKSRIEIIQSE